MPKPRMTRRLAAMLATRLGEARFEDAHDAAISAEVSVRALSFGFQKNGHRKDGWVEKRTSSLTAKMLPNLKKLILASPRLMP